ncbi:ActS/PrrB/RegB family redox-sensitive histidine kinase [Devosia sp. YIM 151766]|uniref:ActS/PrrB/RegB family redox-sensitive histidine kinase n=1 Tax=Devosia sp. YIM 151766 TaxID=3017325 RepID=UPI00255C9E37|nr:ActS/PrrB/RegB family redox-sensitive histidine kinase [Devosia sp. YIM 151766]WIY53244.1 ActS/PrrB/RegB family redox-sensitive histidine kinase [Devosia sp. YIM 151766]
MNGLAPTSPLPPAGWRPLRLQTLLLLRWLAVAGQITGVLFVYLGLGFPLPLWECMGLIALSAALNIGLVWRYGTNLRLSSPVAALQLTFDLCQLGGLLALTGGLQNPFSLLLLAPVSVSASTLPQRQAYLVAFLACLIASLISVLHLPLPWDPTAPLAFNRIYVIGIWVSIICGVVFISTYTNRVAHDSRQIADALAATELALSRREQLSALDGLAAAAAHELGTPLSTIALAAKEMRAEVEEGGPLAEDVELIIEQSARCRAILAKLRNLGNEPADLFAEAPLTDILDEVARPHEGRGKAILFYSEQAAGPAPVFPRSVGLLYGLGNLIENATDFAKQSVRIDSAWDQAAITVSITDDGRGFAPELIARLGEPYLTSRPRDPAGSEAHQPGGLGLGIFIAKTLLERTGAKLRFDNADPAGHARVTITWQRNDLNQRPGA